MVSLFSTPHVHTPAVQLQSYMDPDSPSPASRRRVQIWLTDGAALTSQFAAKEALAAVRLYVQMNRTDGQSDFTLGTAFPRRVFTPEDYERPLDSLGESGGGLRETAGLAR